MTISGAGVAEKPKRRALHGKAQKENIYCVARGPEPEGSSSGLPSQTVMPSPVEHNAQGKADRKNVSARITSVSVHALCAKNIASLPALLLLFQ